MRLPTAALALVLALPALAQEGGVDRLLEGLADADAGVRERAADALVDRGRPVAAAVARLAGDEDAASELRLRARSVLVAIEVEAAPVLAARLRHARARLLSPSPDVRRAALHALGNDPDVDDHPALVDLLLADEPQVASHTLSAGWSRGRTLAADRLPARLVDPYRSEVVDLSDPATGPALIAGVAEAGPRAGWCAMVLGLRRDERAVDALLEQKGAENVFVRSNVGRALILLGQREAGVGALESMTGRYEHYYTTVALRDLALQGERRYLGTLIELLVRVEDVDGRANPNQPSSLQAILVALESVTGTYFTTADQWARWWEAHEGEWLAEGQAHPAAPAYVDPSGGGGFGGGGGGR